MDKELHRQWLGIISPLFPDGAYITSRDDLDDFKASVSWLLNNDLAQSDKMSRVVVIEITKETINEYTMKSQIKQKNDNGKLYLQVREFLSAFDPNHDTPVGESPPEVKLVVCTAVLNS